MPLFRILGFLALMGLFSDAAAAQTPADNGVVAPLEAPIATEVLVAPKVKNLDLRNKYPYDEIRNNGEGRVQLGFMVDATGKPFEVTVEDSTGDKVFEQAAVKTVESSTFEPGTLNGRPVESASRLKFVFAIPGIEPGASRAFVRSYKSLMSAIGAKDRSAADLAMKELKIQNLYEDAYFGLATYCYALAWGGEVDQLRGLQRATASDNKPQVWHNSAYDDIVFSYLSLLMKMHHYGEATDVWNRRQKSTVDPSIPVRFQLMVDQLYKLRAADTEYDVAGSMPEGTWNLLLFKKHFSAKVTQGRIVDVKLRCAKGFVRFAFDPDLQYQVASKFGDCSLEIEGDPGTFFTLTQF